MIKRMGFSLSLACCLTMFVNGQDKTPATPADGTVVKQTRRMWAGNYLWTDAPKLEFAKWLSEKPDMEGKFVLVEFWRTWCSACKRVTPRMNALQTKFGKDLVIIAVTAESDEVVKAYKGPKKVYFMALDKPRPIAADTDENEGEAGATAAEDKGEDAATDGDDTLVDVNSTSARTNEQGAFEAHFGVWGWPHAVLLEPTHRTVVWEGYPDLKGYELTEEKVAKYIAISKQTKADPEKTKKTEK